MSRFVTKKPCDAKKRKKESVWLSDVMCSFCSEKVRLKVRAPSHAPCVYFGAFAESDGDCSPELVQIAKVSKRQTNRLRRPSVASNQELVAKIAIFGRFAKYTMTPSLMLGVHKAFQFFQMMP